MVAQSKQIHVHQWFVHHCYCSEYSCSFLYNLCFANTTSLDCLCRDWHPLTAPRYPRSFFSLYSYHTYDSTLLNVHHVVNDFLVQVTRLFQFTDLNVSILLMAYYEPQKFHHHSCVRSPCVIRLSPI